MIAAAMRDRDGNVAGKFCLAMKLVSSASAQSPNQHRLITNANDLYNSSYDEVDELYRIYLQGPQQFEDLTSPHFDIEKMNVIPLPGYDKNGNTEQMCQGILIPKAA